LFPPSSHDQALALALELEAVVADEPLGLDAHAQAAAVPPLDEKRERAMAKTRAHCEALARARRHEATNVNVANRLFHTASYGRCESDVNTVAYGRLSTMAEKDALGTEAWTRAALAALAQGGLKAVAVEPLARALKVTKGSFYWHFENRDALLTAALERWESTQTDALIAAASAVDDPRERLAQLVQSAHRSARGLRLTRALASAADHPIVGPVVRRVSERRLSYLSKCFVSLGLDARAARHAARMAYAAYLGLAELDALGLGLQSKADQHAYLEQLLAVLLPTATTPRIKR
jgi:AcrR family transcriptional regulator